MAIYIAPKARKAFPGQEEMTGLLPDGVDLSGVRWRWIDPGRRCFESEKPLAGLVEAPAEIPGWFAQAVDASGAVVPDACICRQSLGAGRPEVNFPGRRNAKGDPERLPKGAHWRECQAGAPGAVCLRPPAPLDLKAYKAPWVDGIPPADLKAMQEQAKEQIVFDAQGQPYIPRGALDPREGV